MFLIIDELKSAIYGYQLQNIVEITADDDSNNDIILQAISAAVEEMKSYLSTPVNGVTYDVDAIFSAEGNDRNALVLELCKSIAVYYVCRLSNVDILEDKVSKRYDRAIDWLEKVSGTGKHADKATISPDLPKVTRDEDEDESLPFRSGCRDKFNHE